MALTGWSAANFLSRAVLIGTEPFMVSAWGFAATGSASYRTAFSSYLNADVGNDNRRTLRLMDTDQVDCEILADPVQGEAIDGTHPNNIWFNMCGAWVSSTLRSVWMNGGTSSNETTSVTPTTPDRTSIGVNGLGDFNWPTAGGLAEVSIWDVTGFTSGNRDSLAALLAAGDNPINIDAQAGQPWTGMLLRYWPLTNTSTLTDASGNDATPLTMNGTLTNFGSHPTIDPVSSGGQAARTMQQMRMRRQA